MGSKHPSYELGTCQIPYCKEPVYVERHELCQTHYYQWRRYGKIIRIEPSFKHHEPFDLSKVPIEDPKYMQKLSDQDDEEFGNYLRQDMQDKD